MLRVARFLRGYLRDPAPDVSCEELRARVGGREAPALLFREKDARPRPGWVMLHGITVPGMRHPALLRFARAFAGSGAAVLVPEVEAWKRLRIDPRQADLAIAGGAALLAERPEVLPGGVGVVGFSFGATQALVAAADPEFAGSIRSVVAFGGYCDLRRTIGFMLTGEHEWRGERRRLDPDPYGRWIVAANYLTAVPEYSGMDAVAEAARELAAKAGERGLYAGDPLYDPLKARLRTRLDAGAKEVWDLIAPPTGTRPDPEAASALADALVDAALRVHPSLDPRSELPGLHGRPVLVHGRGDRLIPFTETLRLASLLPESTEAVVRVTRLFSHSGGADGIAWHRYPGELWRYATLLDAALRG